MSFKFKNFITPKVHNDTDRSEEDNGPSQTPSLDQGDRSHAQETAQV